MALSAAIEELIAKARIVSFEPWRSRYPADTIALFQAADDNRLYLTDAELDSLPTDAATITAVKLLRDQVVEIVDEARAGVLTQFPEILAPGGGLYPVERAEACWRDFWHFLRCITYGIAGGEVNYTSTIGLDYMRQLYVQLEVPLNAMVLGLEGIKTASLKRIDPAQHIALIPYFDHLIVQLEAFRQVG